MSQTFQNFRDPLGLVSRMLRSKDPAALASLAREAATLALTPIDRCLAAAEARRIRAARLPMRGILLIVGGSRCGTTLIYQVLARYLPVTYFTNLSALFPRAPLTATRLFRLGHAKPDGTFSSYYGNTAGLSGPNDAFHVWNRWLGYDRYRAPDTMSADRVAEMRQFLAAWTETFDRPLLNKNNRNADCVALLGRLLPEAFFIIVRREPISVARSLLVARQEVQGHKRHQWGVRSHDQSASGDPLGYVDSVCRQIVEVERRLDEGRATLPPNRWIEVQYEAFCAHPEAVVAEVAQRTSGSRIDDVQVRRELRLTARSGAPARLTPMELERIEACLAAPERFAAGVPLSGAPSARSGMSMPGRHG